MKKWVLLLISIIVAFPIQGTELIFVEDKIDFDLLTTGGGYNSGGITLYGTGTNKGSGYFANDILIAGSIIGVTDFNVTGNANITGDLAVLGSIYGEMPNVWKAANQSARENAYWKLSNYSSAQAKNSTSWNRAGTNVVLANSGDKVGIGTTSPGVKLEVNGTVAVGGPCSQGDLCVDQAASSGAAGAIYIENPSGGDCRIFTTTAASCEVGTTIASGSTRKMCAYCD